MKRVEINSDDENVYHTEDLRLKRVSLENDSGSVADAVAVTKDLEKPAKSSKKVSFYDVNEYIDPVHLPKLFQPSTSSSSPANHKAIFDSPTNGNYIINRMRKTGKSNETLTRNPLQSLNSSNVQQSISHQNPLQPSKRKIIYYITAGEIIDIYVGKIHQGKVAEIKLHKSSENQLMKFDEAMEKYPREMKIFFNKHPQSKEN